MERGANECTGLNSDEDPDLREEPEDDESDDGSWTDDWDIGYLTDEETAQEAEELPDSIWLSAAKDKRLIASMRDNGWEYGTQYTSKFGADPEYHGLYDGPYGPSDSVLGVADDPIALLFYFMPPKCGLKLL
ncbi:Pleiotropic drug resistance protein [Phytophthora cinnamomi]|uniref:Pleiotropic drug resistance protein n=1 Tax=Phytophthora cinnamomi TaxID=4785 RepID=UPI00355967CD|nr:Pleiotropic drug resistance protein [Phytophthora cinnamomi]